MSVVIDLLSWVLIAAGAAFVVIGSVGLVRFPDFYTRLHPAGVTDTLGAGLVLTGLMLLSTDWLVTAKLVFILL